MTLTATPRPYIMTFSVSGNQYPLTSADAQRAIDDAIRCNRLIDAEPNRVILRGYGENERVTLQPATRGGGPAFEVTRS